MKAAFKSINNFTKRRTISSYTLMTSTNQNLKDSNEFSTYGAKCILLLSIIFMEIALPCQAHGYLSVPKSRNKLANERSWPSDVNYCPHCLNAEGRRTSNYVYPETEESARSHGLCGDKTIGGESCWNGGLCPEQDHMPGGKFYTVSSTNAQAGAVQEVYIEGEVIDIEFIITAHHRGVISLRLCDEARVTETCLQVQLSKT